jgi:hypothetical protein
MLRSGVNRTPGALSTIVTLGVASVEGHKFL